MSPSPSDLFGIPVAVLALIVACLSFGVAVFALGWQIVKHLLDGGRVRVYLNTAIVDDLRNIAINANGKWEIRHPFEHGPSRGHIELAQLVIENPGRTSVTIHGPTLSISGTGKRHYAICPRLFTFDGGGSHSATAETQVRLEPHSRVTYLLDYWSIVPRIREEANGNPVRIRGMVHAAGYKRPRKSSRRLTWRIPEEAWTTQTNVTEVDPFTIMWQELYRSHWNSEGHSSESTKASFYELEAVLHQARSKISTMPSRGELQEVLKVAAKELSTTNFPLSMLSYNIHRALEEKASHLSAWKPASRAITAP